MNKLLIICGPTATGKTNIALQMAKQFNGELVSCDSRQVYKGMDIITGKDLPHNPQPHLHFSPSLRRVSEEAISFYSIDTIPIWGYDLVFPDQEFSVSHYQEYATAAITDIQKRGKLPILVGGTGLYIDAVVYGIGTGNIPRNDALRASLEGLQLVQLQETLEDLSPNIFHALNDSDKQNPRRLIRKIEIATSETDDTQKKSLREEMQTETGLEVGSITSLRGVGDAAISSKIKPIYNSLWIGLRLSKEEQEQRIKQRVAQRINSGALEEVKRLVSSYSWEPISLQAIGYQEWKNYLLNPTEEHYKQAINMWQTHEIQYAKRQMTWFKKKKTITWYDPSSQDYELMVRNQIQSWYNEFVYGHVLP